MILFYAICIVMGTAIKVIGCQQIITKVESRIRINSYLIAGKRKLSVKTDEEIYDWWRSRVIRILNLVSIIFIALGIIGVALEFKGMVKETQEIVLPRPMDEGEIDYSLDAYYPDGTSEDIDVSISSREYTDKEEEKYIKDAFKSAFVVALKDNANYDRIDSSLNLVKRIDENPCSLSWEIEPDSLFNPDGEMLEEVKEEIAGRLTLTVKLNNKTELQTKNLVICPRILSKRELIKKQLMDEISSIDNRQKTDANVILPETVKDVKLDKSDDKTDSTFVMVLIILLPILLYLKERQDINHEEKERKELLITEYPELVNKMVLYLGSGNTIKSSFVRMCEDNDQKHPLYMELSAMVNELNAGVSESECYEKVAKRLKEQSYIRFFNLLIQNLTKGSASLMKMLKTERMEALKSERDYAKKKGEEASTKLLIPMILLLLVSMVIVMVPALLSMSR